jgi:MoaA/NifB/PqqE/SkfB family radical SAM enzyme
MSHNLTDSNIVKIHNFNTTIDWHFGNQCQYACSYCPEYLHAGDSKKLELEQLKEFVLAAQDNLTFVGSSKKIIFTFAGGEPTLNSAFGPLVKWLRESGHVVSLVSNAGRTLRWWQEWGEYFDGITLSFHTEETDLEHFVAVADYVSNITRTEAHIIAWPNNFDRVKQAHSHLAAIKNCITFVKRVNQSWVPKDRDFRDYTAEESAWIDQNLRAGSSNVKAKKNYFIETTSGEILSGHPMTITNSKLNNFYGWSCNQGVSHLGISVYGDVHGAHCKQLHMGSIYDLEKINWVKEPSLCRQLQCTCIGDIIVTKNKITN